MKRGAIVITMAGLGSRFRNAGYAMPKYQIPVHRRTLFAWSIGSLTNFIEAGWPFVFVVLKGDNATPFIADECRALGIKDFDVVELDALTDGQATSATCAMSAIPDHTVPIGIYNIDTFVEPEYLQPADMRGAGWIPCFPGQGDKWSFVRAKPDGLALEVREKIRISNHATVGFYAFDSAARYLECYRSARQLEAGERYVAPLYNHLIANGEQVYISQIPASAVHPLGVPEDVELFLEPPVTLSRTHSRV